MSYSPFSLPPLFSSSPVVALVTVQIKRMTYFTCENTPSKQPAHLKPSSVFPYSCYTLIKHTMRMSSSLPYLPSRAGLWILKMPMRSGRRRGASEERRGRRPHPSPTLPERTDRQTVRAFLSLFWPKVHACMQKPVKNKELSMNLKLCISVCLSVCVLSLNESSE